MLPGKVMTTSLAIDCALARRVFQQGVRPKPLPMPGEQGRSWDQVAASTQSKVGALQQALGGSPLLSQALVMEDSLSMVQQLADFGATMEQWTLEHSEEVPPEDYRRYRGRLVGVSFRMTVGAPCRHKFQDLMKAQRVNAWVCVPTWLGRVLESSKGCLLGPLIEWLEHEVSTQGSPWQVAQGMGLLLALKFSQWGDTDS